MKPVFVYGTLKSNMSNVFSILNNYNWNSLNKKPAEMKGDLYVVPNASFPTVGKINTENTIHGELVYINNNELLNVLDYIENEGVMYSRISTTTTDNEECWVYQWKNINKLIHKIENGIFEYLEINSTLCIPIKYKDNKPYQIYVPVINDVITLN
jgi:gamma-glutamylcyclotransferase (GGCT)/AIG2-like uncharacterized protein YtfP